MIIKIRPQKISPTALIRKNLKGVFGKKDIFLEAGYIDMQYNDEGTPDEAPIIDAFKKRLELASNIKWKKLTHISFIPFPCDIISDDNFIKMGHRLLYEMGHTTEPYIMIKHITPQTHIHLYIVICNVNEDGKSVKPRQDYAWFRYDLPRIIEEEYNLHKTDDLLPPRGKMNDYS